ncbi:MAG: hypothetical protein KAG66_13845 [Methylococcales bacterium]|nr:hypothetical protein [Methylococcales bacterium]
MSVEAAVINTYIALLPHVSAFCDRGWLPVGSQVEDDEKALWYLLHEHRPENFWLFDDYKHEEAVYYADLTVWVGKSSPQGPTLSRVKSGFETEGENDYTVLRYREDDTDVQHRYLNEAGIIPEKLIEDLTVLAQRKNCDFILNTQIGMIACLPDTFGIVAQHVPLTGAKFWENFNKKHNFQKRFDDLARASMQEVLNSADVPFASVGATYDSYNTMTCRLSLLSVDRAAELSRCCNERDPMSLWDYADVCPLLSGGSDYQTLFRQWADALNDVAGSGALSDDELNRSEDRFIVGIAQVLHLWCHEFSTLKGANAIANY